MNAKNRIIIALSVCLLFGAGLVYLRFSNFSISADQLASEQSNFCTVNISGQIQLTHSERDSRLNLKLVDGDQTLAEITPTGDKYSFSISNHLPNDNWNILATETLNGRQIQYPVVALQQISCDSTNTIDLQF